MYSILIPTYNGLKYLPACIDSIVSQNYDNYEVIISDDHSTDGTREYLEGLSGRNNKIKSLFPPVKMSMTEHWNWVLDQANGDWIIFVGQDDGLQPYFFELAEALCLIASGKGIRTISSKRAYFFWPGCEERFGPKAIEYEANSRIYVKQFWFQSLLAMFGFKTYFDLPQMYTTSIFHKSLIDEAKHIQSGSVLTTHPQDANLAALAATLESKYLRSQIPLGWVGSSPRSAGMSIRIKSQENSVKEDYLNKIAKSDLECHPLAGDFRLGSLSVYFWNSLLQTQLLRKAWINRLLLSKFFRFLFLITVKLNPEIRRNQNIIIKHFRKLVEINRFNFTSISLFANVLYPVYLVVKLLLTVREKISTMFSTSFRFRTDWITKKNSSLKLASKEVRLGVKKAGLFRNLIE